MKSKKKNKRIRNLALVLIITLLISSSPQPRRAFGKDLDEIIESTPTTQAEKIINRITILEDSNINLTNSDHFAVGDFDGDSVEDILLFDSKYDDIKGICVIGWFHENSQSKFEEQKSSEFEIKGEIFYTKSGNFDTDDEDEVIIGCKSEKNSYVYIINFGENSNEENSRLIYQSEFELKKMNILADSNQIGKIVLLFNDLDFNTGKLNNYVVLLEKKDHYFVSTDIYFENNTVWNSFCVGEFLWEVNEPMILLYQYYYQQTSETKTFAKIIDFSGRTIIDRTEIDQKKRPRDLISWDTNDDGQEELVILESEEGGDQFNNFLSIIKIKQDHTFEKEMIKLDSNMKLKEIQYRNWNNKEEIFILDPFSVTYRLAFAPDSEFKTHCLWMAILMIVFPTWQSYLEAFITSHVERTTELYETHFDMDIVYVTYYSPYSSTGSTPQLLFNNLQSVFPTTTRATDDVDVICGIIYDTGGNSAGGIGNRPGDHVAMFRYHRTYVLAHELGHTWGMVQSSEPNHDSNNPSHCDNEICIMSYGDDRYTFCSDCNYFLDNHRYQILLHIQTYGDIEFHFNNQYYLGISSKRIEGFEINIRRYFDIRYMVFSDGQWGSWITEGNFAGTRGQALAINAFKIELTGTGLYNVRYRAEMNTGSDPLPATNGAIMGDISGVRWIIGLYVEIYR